uniref:Cystathionine beta-synthase n=1 Tax=Culicoides sonorensis TaxID=179676 RepID=A0A336M9I0_CULSO
MPHTKTTPTAINLDEINAMPLKNFVRPDKPSSCTWHRNIQKDPELLKTNPHTVRPFCKEKVKIIPDILHAIGSTPMVRLNRIPQSMGIECEMYAKCEYLSPGGSVKDRIGYRMVLDAEERGLLKPGATIIEPTSGNTGIGLAMASAVKGYRCIIVMPLKMSDEKVGTLTALGAEIIRTPTEAAFDDEAGLIAVAQKIQQKIPNSVILNQYTNPGNPLAHYDQTGAEILWSMDDKIDMAVLGAGTGGTVSGVARRIKEVVPTCEIVAVDPEGSILAQPEELNETETNYYEVEGIGYDFIPTVLDRSVVDTWIKVADKDALPMARRLIREEGLLCGGSSGAAMVCALKAAKKLKKGQKCVVLLPDNIRNYMTKFVQDTWMEIRNLKDPENVVGFSWWDAKLGNSLEIVRKNSVTIKMSCQEVANYLKDNEIYCAMVLDADNKPFGYVTTTHLLTALVNGKLSLKQAIKKDAFFHQLTKARYNTTLGQVARALEKEQFLAVVKKNDDGSESFDGFILQKDILAFVAKSHA